MLTAAKSTAKPGRRPGRRPCRCEPRARNLVGSFGPVGCAFGRVFGFPRTESGVFSSVFQAET